MTRESTKSRAPFARTALAERRSEHRSRRAERALFAAALALVGSSASIGSARAQWKVDAAGNLTYQREERPKLGYWSESEPRWFVSTKSDVGAPYLKPYMSFGYGMPHWIWAGVDVNAITTLEFAQAYAGLRASSPVFDLAFGVRDTKSFGKPLLVPAASYGHDDVVNGNGPGARYWAWEAEAVAVAPLPYSALLFDFIAVRTLDVPINRYLFEESYRAVVARPFFAVLRVAAVARLLREDALKVGVLGEWVFATGRGKNVLRVGPAAALTLTDHLEALATLTVAAVSPDTLGLSLGAYGVAGLRYRWASGERRPELPWRGELVP